MEKFKILPHIADLRIKSWGKDQKELFLNSLLGMSLVLKPNILKIKPQKEIKKKIDIFSPDSTALLIDFLSEVLAQNQIEKVVFYKAKFSKLTDKGLEGEISGIKVDSFDEDIKAVTYYKAEIKKNHLLTIVTTYDI